MRSSAIAGFLASAVLVSGSAGFASTFLVGPYLGEQVRHQTPRAALMNTASAMDPLAVVVRVPVAKAEGEAPASQTARRLRHVENAPTTTAASTTARPAATLATTTTTSGEMPGPITEEAFTPTSPSTLPAATGGPLIATEASSVMMSSKLENGEPVLTLRIAPFVAPTAPTADLTDPDNAIEPTVISAPPSEQPVATTAAMTTPVPEAEPVTPPPPPAEPAPKPRKPAIREAAPAPEPARKPVKPRTPARVTTTAPAAPAAGSLEEQLPVAPPPAPDPLNAPYTPSASPTLSTDEPSATGAPAPMTGQQPQQPASTGGPTPLTMPQ